LHVAPDDAAESVRAMEALNAELRASEERYRTLFDLCPVTVYSCDAAGVIQAFNHRAAELWGREPLPGDTDARFCGSSKMFRPDGSFMPHEQCPMAQVVSGAIPGVRDGEVRIERPDGSHLTVIVNIRPLKTPDGRLTGAINCFYDITERSRLVRQTREQAAALVDLHRRKDEFLAMLSHELRNPLAPIVNALELLRRHNEEDAFQNQIREMMTRQVGRLTRLVDDLLDVSRITTGMIRLHAESISVSDIMGQAAQTVRPLIEQRRHELNVSLPPQATWLHADAARLEQVLVNLLTNAAKYTDEGGRIWLSAGQEDDAVVLRVRDTGVGMAPELLPHIFEMFTQAERSLDRSQGGLGIGLCLVQRLVELHGGTVDVHSALGEGSEFVVRLPVMRTPMATSSSPTVATVEPPGTGRRVLIVDDSVDTAQSLAMLLKTSGHDVRIAHDGQTGLEASLDHTPDGVLLDIGLPGLSGYDVAMRMRQQPGLGHVMFIAMTGYGQGAALQRSQEAGFDHHLVKPADFSKVQEILSGVAQT
jgi:PAS domain S-box-containing protein